MRKKDVGWLCLGFVKYSLSHLWLIETFAVVLEVALDSGMRFTWLFLITFTIVFILQVLGNLFNLGSYLSLIGFKASLGPCAHLRCNRLQTPHLKPSF